MGTERHDGPDVDSSVAELDNTLRRKIVRSSGWIGVGYGGGQLLSFASMLVLVRLLEPKAFGVVAVGMALLAVVTQIQESGVGAALVHSRRDPRITAASGLVFAVASGTVLALAVVLLAPLYTHIVRLPEATSIVRALSLVLVIRGIAVVPGAILERSLGFRARTAADLGGFVTQAAVAISCAVAGLGAWSLVAGQVGGAAVQALVLWLLVPWRPALHDASRRVLAEMLRYGRFVSGTNILNLVNRSLDTVAVGRVLGASAVGAYALAWRLSEIPNTFIGVVVGRVMFSVYSQLQHDLAAVRAAYLENLQRTLLLALPVSVGLAIAAEPVVLALLGDGWEAVVAPLRILAVYGLVRLITAPSGEVFKGIGRPHLSLVSSAVYFVVAAIALLLLLPRHGTSGAALAMLAAVVVSGVVALTICLRALELSPKRLAQSLARPAVPAALVAVALLTLLPLTDGLRPFPTLLVLLAGGSLAFAVGAATVARPLVTPVWAALRRS